MLIYETPQIKNRCYIRAAPITPVGILVHSTGAVNTTLKRYVDAPETLGKNRFWNHWNKSIATKCMHAFIGQDVEGNIAVAHTLPYTVASWGCGRGKRGSYNYNPTAHIQFEICQGSKTDKAYYDAAIAAAIEFCAHLCQTFSLPSSSICSHAEAARRGFASNHGDPDSWMKPFGGSMTAFRAAVAALIGEQPSEIVLRFGSRSDDVKQLQAGLNRRGAKLKVDGIFGKLTEAAVRTYQVSKGYKATGDVGRTLLEELLK